MYYKYPRTPHLPFSPGVTVDDKKLTSTDIFDGKEVVITEKMDGENTSIYNDFYHARSIDSKHRDYHSYLLSVILPKVQYQIPDGWRICGEYMYAKHSIYYENLKDYFLCFSIWNENNQCLSWEETKKICNDIDICTVPEIYQGIYDENKIKKIALDVERKGGEGIVVRNTQFFNYSDFFNNIAKYVRKNHVQTDAHWTFGKIEKNKMNKGLKDE